MNGSDRRDDLEFQKEVVETLAYLKTNMKSLVGNGQPGRIKLIEDKVGHLTIAVAILGVGGGGAWALPHVLALLK